MSNVIESGSGPLGRLLNPTRPPLWTGPHFPNAEIPPPLTRPPLVITPPAETTVATPASATKSALSPEALMALIKSNPAYVSWLGTHTQNLNNLASNRKELIRRAILAYGGLPKGFTDVYGDLSPEDLTAAETNPFSVEHTIQRNYEMGVQAMKKSLAGRGFLQSGELGYCQEQADYAKGQAEYGAGN